MQEQSEYRKTANRTSNGALVLSLPWRFLCTVPGSMGDRAVGSPVIVLSLLLMFVWACFTQSQLLLYGGLPIAVLSYLEHRRKTRPLNGVHSWYMGATQFRRMGEKNGRNMEVVLALALGAALATVDKGAGMYLMCAGVGHMFTLGFVRARDERTQQDLDDARIEGAYRAGRHTKRPLF